MIVRFRQLACAAVLIQGVAGCASASPQDAVEGAGNWQLVWADEFDGSRIDRSKWDFDVDCWGGGNGERQCYTDRPANAAIRNGTLIIEARKETTTGPALPPYLAAAQAGGAALATRSYSSARLVTRGKASWRYGKVEVRAKLPQGQGIWPAIWMLPDDGHYGRWASSGEIDILEAVNLGVECPAQDGCEEGGESTILGTLHFGGVWPENAYASTEVARPEVLDGEFHTFGIEWGEGIIVWTFDGRPFATKRAGDWFTVGSDHPAAPFDRNFHLILNLAVGGRLPEERALRGVDDSGFPKQMAVDWVRVWQCGADPATARSCILEGKE